MNGRFGIVGRGAAGNPKNRFERISVEPDPEEFDPEATRPETVYLRDNSRSIIARNASPDIDFDATINDPHFGSRMKGEGFYADHIARLFEISCRRAGIEKGRFPGLSTAAFRRSEENQPSLFD